MFYTVHNIETDNINYFINLPHTPRPTVTKKKKKKKKTKICVSQ